MREKQGVKCGGYRGFLPDIWVFGLEFFFLYFFYRYYLPARNNRDSVYTDKKENKIFLIYKEIQKGAVAKSYMTDGLALLIYD
jgi:hypothetical protein